MKKQVKLPSGDLGTLGVINIDLEMKAKHYDDLTVSTGDHNEEVVLSILKDLMEEDPYQLTQIDLMYVFTLVKIATIGSKLKVNTVCPIKIATKTGVRICGAPFTCSVNLTEDDCIYKDPKEDVPTITLNMTKGPETFPLHLPTMAQELELLEEFEKDGHTRRQILFEDRSLLADYTKKRCILHIKTNAYTSKELLEALNNSSFAARSQLSEDVLKLNQYGLKHKKYTCQCKECGGKFEYHLPLLFGLPL